jgi:aminoglycoside phosphotransferase (APT) family kinase protein
VKLKATPSLIPALAGYSGADRHALFHAKIDVLSALAQLDPIALGLEGFGKPSGYIDRQLGTWTRQYRASETEPIAAMEFLLAELPNCLDWRSSQLLRHPWRLSGWIIC